MSDYLPGSFFVTSIPGWAGDLIGIGQALALSPSCYEHAGVITSEDGDTVEAAPGGAYIGHMRNHRIVLVSDPVAWVMSQMTPQQAKVYEPVGRRAVVIEARDLVGTQYSALDYVAIALVHIEKMLTRRPRPTWRITKWIRRRVQSSRRMICSQLVDACFERAGIHLFDDGRLPGDVMPSDLAAWAEDWAAGR